MQYFEHAALHAETVIEMVISYGLDTSIQLAHPKAWAQGARFVQSENPYTRALGYTIMLTAFLETPDATNRLIASIRDATQGFFDEVEDAA